MRETSVEPRQLRLRRLIAEAQELVEDRARACDLCRRRMRFFPVRGQTVVRTFGRSHGWRCIACTMAQRMLSAELSGEGITPKDLLTTCTAIAGDLVTQFEELSRAPSTPLFIETQKRLCMQMQMLGEAIADHQEAVALDNLIVLAQHRAQRPARLRPTTESPSASL